MELRSSRQKYHDANYTLYYLEHTQRRFKVMTERGLRHCDHVILYYILTLRHYRMVETFNPRKIDFVACNKTRLCVC